MVTFETVEIHVIGQERVCGGAVRGAVRRPPWGEGAALGLVLGSLGSGGSWGYPVPGARPPDKTDNGVVALPRSQPAALLAAQNCWSYSSTPLA